MAGQAVHPPQVGLAQRQRQVDPEVDDVDQLGAGDGVGALPHPLQGEVGGEMITPAGLSLRWVVNGLEFGRALRSLRDILGWRVPTSWAVPGGSADGEDRLGC